MKYKIVGEGHDHIDEELEYSQEKERAHFTQYSTEAIEFLLRYVDQFDQDQESFYEHGDSKFMEILGIIDT